MKPVKDFRTATDEALATQDQIDAERYREWRRTHTYWRDHQKQLDDALDFSIEWRKTHH